MLQIQAMMHKRSSLSTPSWCLCTAQPQSSQNRRLFTADSSATNLPTDRRVKVSVIALIEPASSVSASHWSLLLPRLMAVRRCMWSMPVLQFRSKLIKGQRRVMLLTEGLTGLRQKRAIVYIIHAVMGLFVRSHVQASCGCRRGLTHKQTSVSLSAKRWRSATAAWGLLIEFNQIRRFLTRAVRDSAKKNPVSRKPSLFF